MRPDHSFSKGCLNSVKKKKREKTSTKLFIKLFAIITTLYISPKDTRVRLNLFVLGSLIWLSSPYNCPARLEPIATSLSGLSANVDSHPPLSLLTDGAGDTWTATRLHLLKLHPGGAHTETIHTTFAIVF